jgi:hypothetical protein
MGKDREPRDPPEWDDDPDLAEKVVDLAKRATAKLPDIAKIPPEQREAFCKHAMGLIVNTQSDIILRGALLRHFQEGGQGDAAIFK